MFITLFIVQIVKTMMLTCVTLNERLYESERPVLLTVTAAKKGTLSVSLYFPYRNCPTRYKKNPLKP